MAKIRTYLAYVWALMAVTLVLLTFMKMPFLAETLVAATGLHVHPIYTGGEVVRTLEHEGYTTLIHRPVFDGLVGERKHGFVQVTWRPKDANLPDLIDEGIDFDADGTSDFHIKVNTKSAKADLETRDPRVGSVQEVLKVKNDRVVRVGLQKASK